MATLLLRLAAPLQAWGADSKFETRKTGREPTKSGVIGLLAAALGLRRDDEAALQALAGLRFAVRVDQEGQLLADYHTAGNPLPHEVARARAAGKTVNAQPYVTHRYYLADAVFLAGLESDDEALLQKIAAALSRPVFPLFLGRRACPPTMPLCLGIRQARLLDALQSEPPQTAAWHRTDGKSYRIVTDAAPGEPGAAARRDLPLSFSPIHRQYGYRAVRQIDLPASPASGGEPPVQTEHDPFAELR